MNLLLKKTNLIFIIFTFLFTSSLPATADKLSSMVEGVLESHEDIINSKELEEASRDVTDALLVMRLDLSVKLEAGQNDKYNACQIHKLIVLILTIGHGNKKLWILVLHWLT